jgi:alkanesulfonate monooxygenase SsuD/methylene tetrahydromethanopterin reductase-like flavin-dependent oxidoreductase (luciferase family)
VQQPHPPIVIGGSGERRTLRTAARFAQHWNFVGGSPEEFARKRDVLYAHCHDIGRDPKEITLSSHIRLGADGDTGPAVDTAAALGELGLDLAIVILPPPHDPAVLTPLADALTQLRA